MRLRILTLNTWKQDGDYPRRLVAMRRGLSALTPDLVLLQEAFRTEEPHPEPGDTATVLAAACGLESHPAPGRFKQRLWAGGPVRSSSGLAVLSRPGCWAPGADVELPSSPAGGDRRLQLGRWTGEPAGEGPGLMVGNLHLSHRADETPLRARQLAVALETLARGMAEAGAPGLLGGDFNAPPDHPSLEPLTRGLARFGVTGAPCRRRGVLPPTHPLPARPDRAARAIDQVWWLALTGGSREPPACTVERVLDQPDPATGVYPSDHAGLLLDLDWRIGASG
ncbi:MAG: endonuclease/exonuclease/phosphatase family protein [Opitutales bacterium]